MTCLFIFMLHDDTQIYTTFSTDNSKNDLQLTIQRINNCLIDVENWMSINKLKLNKDKTELLYFFSKFNQKIPYPSLQFGTDVVTPSPFARNIGVLFDSSLTMALDIKQLSKSAFYHLKNISRIRRFLSPATTEKLVHAFISSKIDNNYNSLLFGLPKYSIDRVQSIQNAADRLVTLSRKHHHVTPLLKKLHWLPVPERIKYKIILLTFKALHHQSPLYINDMITIYRPSRFLRSSNSLLLKSPGYNLKTYGDLSCDFYKKLCGWTFDKKNVMQSSKYGLVVKNDNSPIKSMKFYMDRKGCLRITYKKGPQAKVLVSIRTKEGHSHTWKDTTRGYSKKTVAIEVPASSYMIEIIGINVDSFSRKQRLIIEEVKFELKSCNPGTTLAVKPKKTTGIVNILYYIEDYHKEATRDGHFHTWKDTTRGYSKKTVAIEVPASSYMIEIRGINVDSFSRNQRLIIEKVKFELKSCNPGNV
ncbi:hypothetical protein GQR58_025352 [Nymphon striatum]|nr:hypothetical protein GQR58_025352 [Nymphon striatum]